MPSRRLWVLRYPDSGAYIGPHSDALSDDEDVGATISFGASRVLKWQSNRGAAYTQHVPMDNGHVVAFTKEVNESFQHSVLPASDNAINSRGERIVVVVWGKMHGAFIGLGR